MIKLLVHSTLFAAFIYTWFTDSKLLPAKALLIKGQPLSRLGWLTMVDLLLQTIYHAVGVFICLLGYQKTAHRFHFIGRALIGPLGVAVAVLFWGLYFFDPKTLAAGPEFKILIDNWPWNHGLHTLPAVSAVINVLIYRVPNPRFSCAAKTIIGFTCIYIGDVYLINHLSGGEWPYPILKHLGPIGRIVFYIFACGIFICCFVFLSIIHKIVHGNVQCEEKKKNKQKSH